MKMRPWAEFASTLPSDRIDSEDEMDILQYPGKLLSETLAEILKGLGYEIIDLIYLHERGWELHIRGGPKGRSAFGIRVTQIEKYLIVLFQTSWFRTTFAPRHPDLVAVLTCAGSPLRRSSAVSREPFGLSNPDAVTCRAPDRC